MDPASDILDDFAYTSGPASEGPPSEQGIPESDPSVIEQNPPTSPDDTEPTLVDQTPDTPAVGLSDPKLSEARRRKLDAINRLHSLGAHLDVDIPQIVVIGSQSAGKSSLIESISGITLPRASGTCTRCPIECRLVHSTTEWKCTVSLRFLMDELDRPIDPVKNVSFGSPIKNPRDVEDRLRRAQRAVLNPDLDSNHFLYGNCGPDLDNKLQFTRNCVSLEIRGTDVTDLSFCDLPGLIASVSDRGRDQDIGKVQELVSSYISRPSCIILLTVACEADFETQGAYQLARRYDSQGKRTIGVLTKPDRIPDGDEARWLSLIKNEISALSNGWYCVKQPSTKELKEGRVRQDTQRMDEDFFKREPWSTLEARYRRQLGSRAVAQKLNEFLLAVISKRIPEITEELQMMLQRTRDQLQELPARISKDPVLEVMHLIGDFSDDLDRNAEGFNHHALKNPEGATDGKNQFEPIGDAHETFRRVIKATAPDFRPFEGPKRVETQEVSGSQYAPSCAPTPAPSPCYSLPRPITPNPPEPEFFLEGEGNQLCSSRGPVYIDEIVERVQRARTRELPGYFPFHVLQDLVTRSTEQWEQPARALVDAVYKIVSDHRTQLIAKYFSRYTEGGLHQIVSHVMQKYMQRCRDHSLERVKWLLELEAHAFTLNKHYLDDYRNKFLGYYKDQRQQHLGRYAHIASEPWNPNQFAIEIMATVRAYFQVAYKRIADAIPLAIDHELVRVQKRGLQDALFVGLEVTGPEAHKHCQRLLAEPSEIVARREELEHRLVRLAAAHKELMHI